MDKLCAEILRMLKEQGDYLSGQELCGRLDVSRTAVWKAVSRLKEEGYEIEAVRNRGYRLGGEADLVSEEELRAALGDGWLGRTLHVLREVDSTNRESRRLAEEGYPHGTLTAAECQTAGKGRRGRSWSSPAGTGVWMSFLLRPAFAPDRASMLTLIAGIAVARGVREVAGVAAQIKWPNDAVVNGKKICGILTEMSTEEDAIRYVVVGIGINVNTESFPEEIAQTATSLLIETGRRTMRCKLIAAIAREFERLYAVFEETHNLSRLRGEYEELLANKGRTVCVLDPKGEYRGEALGIDEEGSLLVRREDGSVVRVISGEVSVRGVYGYV